jgi:hypothetical protein
VCTKDSGGDGCVCVEKYEKGMRGHSVQTVVLNDTVTAPVVPCCNDDLNSAAVDSTTVNGICRSCCCRRSVCVLHAHLVAQRSMPQCIVLVTNALVHPLVCQANTAWPACSTGVKTEDRAAIQQNQGWLMKRGHKRDRVCVWGGGG